MRRSGFLALAALGAAAGCASAAPPPIPREASSVAPPSAPALRVSAWRDNPDAPDGLPEDVQRRLAGESRTRDVVDPRVPVDAERVDVAQIPRGEVPPRLSLSVAPETPFAEPPTDDVVASPLPPADGAASPTVWLVDVPRIRIGWLQIGERRLSKPSASGGMEVRCGAADRSVARWETLVGTGTARPKYVVTDAWFDHEGCRAHVVRTTTIDVEPLPGTLLFAFRSPGKDRDDERLVVVGAPVIDTVMASVPTTEPALSGSMIVASLPIAKGGASSFSGFLGPVQIDAYRHLIAPPPGSAAVELRAGRVGVELAQGVDESSPSLVVYRPAG